MLCQCVLSCAVLSCAAFQLAGFVELPCCFYLVVSMQDGSQAERLVLGMSIFFLKWCCATFFLIAPC